MNLSALLAGAPPGAVKVVVLERRNISAEFASWTRALASGNWGATPLAQQDGVSNGFRNPARANATTFTQFAEMHDRWFRLAREFVPPPQLLHLWSEDLTGSNESLGSATRRVLTFLGAARPESANDAYAEVFARG